MDKARLNNATLAKDHTGATVLRKHVQIDDLIAHSHQFARLLTAPTPEFCYEELVEDFRASVLVNNAQGRVLVVMADNSSVEFFKDAPLLVMAHEADVLDRVLQTDSRTWAHPNNGGKH